MPNYNGLYAIRDYIEADFAFISSTFLRGLYHGDSWFSKMNKQDFMVNYHPILKALVESPRNTVKVACLKDDPETIIGYSILSSDFRTLHWVHVKRNFRLAGVATSLTPTHPAAVTHLTAVGLKLLKSKLPSTKFNPFSI